MAFKARPSRCIWLKSVPFDSSLLNGEAWGFKAKFQSPPLRYLRHCLTIRNDQSKHAKKPHKSRDCPFTGDYF
jgi:hypothetical protein